MSMTLSGNGTITGLVSGGLPDGTVLPADLSTGGPYWDTSGNLSVGMAAADAYTRIQASGAIGSYYGAGTVRTVLYSANGYALVGTSTNHSLQLITNGTTQATIDTSGNLQFNSGYGSAATAYGCRAWVNFNGTGTVAIRASGNVSSITDDGTGNYTVNFTAAMPDANYGFLGFARDDGLANVLISASSSALKSVSAMRFYVCQRPTGAFTDSSEVDVAIFR